MVSALVTVYKNNVLKFQDGTMGAVNGMRPNGQVSCAGQYCYWTSYPQETIDVWLFCYLQRLFVFSKASLPGQKPLKMLNHLLKCFSKLQSSSQIVETEAICLQFSPNFFHSLFTPLFSLKSTPLLPQC